MGLGGAPLGTLLRRVLRRLRRLLPGDEYPDWVRLESRGDELQFEVWSDVERYRIEEYGGEREFLTRFLGHLRPDDVVYDVGASVGLVTVLAASVVGDGAVVAFEPDPETRARLRRNVQINGLTNVVVVDWAASDKDSTDELFTDGASGYAPSLRQSSRDEAPTGRVVVETRRIDSAVEAGELQSPSVLKVDIEGAEGLCIRGARKTLQGNYGQSPRLLFVELHPVFLPDFGDSAEEIQAMATDLGFNESWRLTRDDEKHICFRSGGLCGADEG